MKFQNTVFLDFYLAKVQEKKHGEKIILIMLGSLCKCVRHSQSLRQSVSLCVVCLEKKWPCHCQRLNSLLDNVRNYIRSWVLYPKEMMMIPCNKSIFFLKQTQMYVKKWVWIFLSSLEKPSSRHLFSTILHAWTPKKAGFPPFKKTIKCVG